MPKTLASILIDQVASQGASLIVVLISEQTPEVEMSARKASILMLPSEGWQCFTWRRDL